MKQWQMVSVSMCLVAAGRAEAKPAWCPDSMMQVSQADANSDKPDALVDAVLTAECSDSPQADANAIRSKVSTRLGMTDADWSDAGAWVNHGRSSIDVEAQYKLAWTNMGPVEQFAGAHRAQIAAGSIDAPYFFDALGPRLTETGRAGFIDWCIASDKPVVWAMCQPDIDVFDMKKALTQIGSDKVASPQVRMQVRITIAGLGPKLKQHAADVSALLAKDAVYKQMFDIAKQERSAWDARYKANDPTLDVAAEMEDATVTESRKAAEGCRDKTWTAVKGVISKIPAKSFVTDRLESDKFDMQFFDRIRDTFATTVFTDERAFPAVNAYVMCWELQDDPKPKDALVALVAPIGSRVMGARGPRTSTASSIFLANLKPDDRSAQIEFPRTERQWFRGPYDVSFSDRAVVSAVKPAGDKVTIEFEKKKHEELVVFGCHETNHIRAIHSDGTLVYDEVCTGTKMKTFMVGPPPETVDKVTAAGVKPGVMVMTGAPQVLLVWPNAKAEAPSFVLGQPVK